MDDLEPLVFAPYFRPQVWGGRRLERYLGQPLPGKGGFGEAWVLSAQSLHVSRVAEGPLQATRLDELWAARQDKLTGSSRGTAAQFPLLFKYLDCQDLLSIQVHPTDEIATRLRPGELGKTEAWVVLEADPTARIYAGLRPGVTRADVQHGLEDGTLAECLHSFVPRKGDCIFLAAGTVHAVGGGVLIAEVQQSSDATFRLFDWNRVGADGKPRALHRDEALASIDFSAGPVMPVEGEPIQGLPKGVCGRRLVACRYFSLDRFELSGPLALPYCNRLSMWMVLEGMAVLSNESIGYRRHCHRGEMVLVPACASQCFWMPDGPVTLLGVLGP